MKERIEDRYQDGKEQSETTEDRMTSGAGSAASTEVQQSCDKLRNIQKLLSDHTTFQSAAAELLDWCADTRVFHKLYEESIFNCLTVVSKVAAQRGFDLDLGYRLLAVCSAHQDKFSCESAAQLSHWCEELGKLLLLRKSRALEGARVSASSMHHSMPKAFSQVPQSDGTVSWQQGGTQQQQQQQSQQQSLSVVATVWGVTQTTNSPQLQSNSFGQGPMTNMNPQFQGQQHPFASQGKAGYNMPAMQGMGHYSRERVMPPYRTSNVPAGGGYHGPIGMPQMGPGGGGMPPHHQQPPMSTNNFNNRSQPAAAAAAAVVAAAAATATATATATVTAMKEQEEQQQQMTEFNQQMRPQSGYNVQYQNQGGGPPMNQMSSMPRHPSMYNQGMMNRGLPQQPPSYMKRPYPGHPGHHGHPGHPGHPSHPNHPNHPSQQGFTQGPVGQPYNNMPPQMGPKPDASQYPTQNHMASANYPPNMAGKHPTMGPHFSQGGQYFPRPGTPNGSQYGPQGMTNQGMNYPPGIPGNPTPPLTPSPSIPPYMSPTRDVKPFPRGIPDVPNTVDELRMTFPVRDGVVLEPFRLEHNLAVSNHVFQLRPTVHQTLTWRSDLELQFKCYHHEDRQMHTNWPASVQVSVNAEPLTIERGEHKTSHKPLYLKRVCQAGRNTIQITVTACCCSHLFVLQLVHRPTLKSVLYGLLRKRLLPAEHCITKIKRNFASVAASSGALNGEDGVEQTAIKVSLKCPITFKPIQLPARGSDCKHIQCFDLQSYLQLNCERGSWRCPVCTKTALLEGLEVDQFMWGILTAVQSSEFEEVTIDATASWKPVALKPDYIKEEETDQPCHAKRFKAMSPNSMTMPGLHTYDQQFGGQRGHNANFPMMPESFNQIPQSSMPPSSGAPNSFSGPPISHFEDNIATTDMVPVEKQFNHALGMNLQHSMPHPNSHPGAMRHPGPPHPHPGTHKVGSPAMVASQHPGHTPNAGSPRTMNIRQANPGMPHTPTMSMVPNGMPSTPNSIMAPHTPNSMPGNHGMGGGGPMGGGGGSMGSRPPPMSNSNMAGAPMNNSSGSMGPGPPMAGGGPPMNSGMPSGPSMTSGGNMGNSGPPMGNSSGMAGGPPMNNPNQGGMTVSTTRAPQVNSNPHSNSGGPASVGTPHSQTNPCTPQPSNQPNQGQRSGTPNTPMPNTPRGAAPPPPAPPPQTTMAPAPSNQSNATSNNELNFDPAAVIDGAGDSQDALESLLTSENIDEELLSILGPDTATNEANDSELLSLFDS
ncbi:zinc finger MIZ domain-containing protein 1-like isoform X2 [Apostichopus japonicus]|uniref:zinc finger MIZ domain-containing protein 1-like isoform X2 n=1 Tax=Stichopus japonicus TaxID=307972 RepID=UPI003AB3CC5E